MTFLAGFASAGEGAYEAVQTGLDATLRRVGGRPAGDEATPYSRRA